MAKTPNLSLNVLPIEEETTKIAQAFMRELGGDTADSNMYLIDSAVGNIRQRAGSKDVWSTEAPVGQVAGDVWHKLIARGEGG